MSTVRERLERLKETIRICESRHRREPGSVALVAVSKRQPVEAVREALAAGQRAYGENYLKEAKTKIETLAEPAAVWPFTTVSVSTTLSATVAGSSTPIGCSL